MSATGLPEGEWKTNEAMLATFDAEYGVVACKIRAAIEEAVLPIMKELETSGRLKDKAVKSVGYMVDDAEGTLRGSWKYSWML